MANFAYTVTNINNANGTITISVTVNGQTFVKRFQTQSGDTPLGVPVGKKLDFEIWLQKYVQAFKAGRTLQRANSGAEVDALVNQPQAAAELGA